MAKTPLGDIPGARFHVPLCAQHAQVASADATGTLGQVGPFAHDVKVTNAWWLPIGAAHSATKASSYRRLTLVNGGSDASGTTVIASLNASATVGQRSPASLATTANNTLAAGNVLLFQQATVGGTDANGTALPAGQFALAYEVI